MSDRYETDHERATGPYDHARWEDSDEDVSPPRDDDKDEMDQARENVLDGWPVREEDSSPALDEEPEPPSDIQAAAPATPEAEPDVGRLPDSDEDQAPEANEIAAAAAAATGAAVVEDAEQAEEAEEAAPETPDAPEEAVAEQAAAEQEHAPGEFFLPPGYPVLEGEPNGSRRAVGVVVSRFNGDVTTKLLESALAELEACGVSSEAVTVMPVPGAFELPLAALALAKTRRFSCVVALGCVVRGDTAHFDYVAGEAASGLQLAALETGVPVAFGLLTLETAEQADERLGKGAEAVRTALEMADLFANLRTAAAQ